MKIDLGGKNQFWSIRTAPDMMLVIYGTLLWHLSHLVTCLVSCLCLSLGHGFSRARMCCVHLHLLVLSWFPGTWQTFNKSVQLIDKWVETIQWYKRFMVKIYFMYMYTVGMCLKKESCILILLKSYIFAHADFILLAKVTSTLNL